MKIDDSRMLNIMYAPADYSHPSRLPEIFWQAAQRDITLLNTWLLHSSKLCDLPEEWRCDDATLSQLLAHWRSVPTIAHLIGGYLLRNRLPARGAALMHDPRLLAFISLPLQHQVIVDDTIDAQNTSSCGVTFIFSQFPGLPLALRQRLLMHFPAEMKPAELTASKTKNHINLLRMALTYAHHYY